MTTRIIQIKNSKGIVLEKELLDKYEMHDEIEMVLEKDYIVLKPFHQPRAGWEEAFKQMHKNGDDKLLIPDVFEDENL